MTDHTPRNVKNAMCSATALYVFTHDATKGDATASHAWLIMHRAASTTRLRSLTQRSLAYINDDMYSDMSGHVGASLRPLTQSIHMYFVMEKNSMQTVPRLLGDLSKCT